MRTLKTVLVLAAGLALALPLIADVSSDATTPTASTSASTKHHHHHKSAVKREPPDPATEIMMKQSDCFTCHSVNAKVIGPAYADVAKKYRNVPGIEDVLVAKVKAGGSGNWGAVPMVAHPQLSDAQLHAMVKWVLAH